MSELKIGFIGVGGVAQPHLNNLSAMDGVKVSAVCDSFADRAKEVGEKFSASVYTDYKKMLETEKLDGVYVCLIPGVHGTTELEIAQKGVPFYIEKPVHLELDACQRVLEQLEKSPVINSVGYHWRYGRGSQAVKKFLEGQQISVVQGYWDGGFVGAPWWRQQKLSGGQLVEQATHIVDLARFLAGEVKSVYSNAATGAMSEIENYDITDASITNLNFKSGAIGFVSTNCIAEEVEGGSKVDLIVKGRGFNAFTNSDEGQWNSKTGGKGEEKGGQPWADQLGNGDRAFIAAIRSGDQNQIVSDYRSGAQTLAVTLAATQSMKSGEVVSVRRFV
ncbi:putative dehydrogenase [Abditibacterium utsteinense]|uniref:Putative dehydrogenase n=1 Tax=Abditibacterium utsteinense TaxID=1960156 RepID=A0A2S8STZ5_9BACT|nr:Gfo/Idh/MocA family oxidoreductase [Abditibacterium utsteinense]PQV64282.1 putative dehydrogenase [Abditibacterium utsteinense]